MKNFSAVINHNIFCNGILAAHVSAKAGAVQADVYLYPDEGYDPEMDQVGDVKRTLSQIDNEIAHLIAVGDKVTVAEGACDRAYLADLVASRKAAAERHGYRKVAKAYRKAARKTKVEPETLADTLGEDVLAKLRAIV